MWPRLRQITLTIFVKFFVLLLLQMNNYLLWSQFLSSDSYMFHHWLYQSRIIKKKNTNKHYLPIYTLQCFHATTNSIKKAFIAFSLCRLWDFPLRKFILGHISVQNDLPLWSILWFVQSSKISWHILATGVRD